VPDELRVGILVGSESDRERMQDATALLDEAGVGYEFEVRSAHRTPDAVAEYARSARDDDGHRRTIGDLGSVREVAGEQRREVTLEPRQERLRLGIPKTAVELDDAEPVLRVHEPGVEEALERSAAVCKFGQHRQVHRFEDLVGIAVGDVGQW